MKRPKRPAESKPGSGIFQTSRSPINSTGIDLSYSYKALCGVGSTSQSLRVHDGGKSRHAERGASNVHNFVKELDKEFHTMLLGRGGKCKACKGGGQQMNQYPQQPLMAMIYTNTDPRYSGRLDGKQGGDTIVTMEKIREAIAFNAELADESTWLWLTSEQMGFPLRLTGGREHEERAEDVDNSRRVHDHLVAYHLAPAIADFILDKNRECCNNELE